MTQTKWLNDSEQAAWRAFLATQGKLTAELNRRLQADSELSVGDFGVLVQLSESAEGRVRSFELADALQWERSRLSHHLARMARRDLVARVECPTDARGAFIVLTDTGRAAIENAAPGHVRAVRELFFGGLSDEQIEALRTIFGTVLARLDATGDQD